MAGEWQDPLNQAYQSGFSNLEQERNRLMAASRHSSWSSGMQDSSLADIGYGQIDKAYLDAYQGLTSDKAKEALGWMKYDQAVQRDQQEQARREKMAKEAGWWKLGGEIAGDALSVIPGGGIPGQLLKRVGQTLTSLPGQAFDIPGQTTDPNSQQPGTPGSMMMPTMSQWGQEEQQLRARAAQMYTNPWQPNTSYMQGDGQSGFLPWTSAYRSVNPQQYNW